METEERNIIQETDYRSLALTEAGKLKNSTPQELLSNADKIYQWLMTDKIAEEERKSERCRMAMERYKKFGCI